MAQQTFIQHFRTIVLPQVQKTLGIKNPMAVPRLKKIVVNVGIGSRYTRSKDFSDVIDNITAITGQKPSVRHSTKSISNFKLRAGLPNGVVVTLRGKRMYDFFNRLVNVALPRIRDFQGISARAFDNGGNYNIGIRDVSVFPEVHQDDLGRLHGIQITIVTSSKSKEHTRALLQACHFPFRKDQSKAKTKAAPVSVQE